MKKIIYSFVAIILVMCIGGCSAIKSTKSSKKKPTVTGTLDGHNYVDLGLPSGRLWATCNVGANKPTENGDYFAWGETSPKKKYDWSTYKWCNGSSDTQTKYCTSSSYGTVDSLTTLLAEDDAATANWGSDWRMPTETEYEELRSGCDWKWSKNFNGSGVAGKVGTSKTNGNTIFLPATGQYFGTDLNLAGDNGLYWSASLDEYYSYYAFDLYFGFGSGNIDCSDGYRHYGKSVRAVVK